MKRVRIRNLIAMTLALIMLVTALPNVIIPVMAAEGTASLTNLGYLGEVDIGKKTESGTWYQTKVDGEPAFCLDLGKSCHTGYVYESKEETIWSTSNNKEDALIAKIGYWYSETKGGANKAWVYAQCLIWAVEEGVISEDGLKDIISQVKNNTGYYPNDDIYDDIFGNTNAVYCDVIEWTYAGITDEEYVQRLMQITSGKKRDKPLSENKKVRYRQRITLNKTDEDGNPLSKVEFQLEAKNIKELYSFKYNGWGDAESGDLDDSDDTQFIADVMTDSKGKITFKFDYQLQSQDYYYFSDEDLEKMDKDAKSEAKKLLDEDGYKYANDLTKSGAEKLAEEDLEKQLDAINNTYILKELATNNKDIVVDGTLAEGIAITIDSTKSWTKEGGKWPDTSSGEYGNYEKAYQVDAVNNHKKVKFTAIKKDSETGTPQGNATLEGAVYGMYEDAACAKLVKQYKTGANGQFETDYIRCGETRYLKEITPPKGYLKNNEVYTIGEDGSSFAAEYNTSSQYKTLYEPVVKGNVEIIKIKSNGAVGITQPEVNAEFQIYLASAGSYDKAKASERDYLVTDADGHAKSKDMPYGTYIVHQTKGDEGTEYVPDFYVDVTQNGKINKYILNNPEFTAYLKVVKKDTQTNQTVLKAGTTYQIFKLDANGNEIVVKQSISNGNQVEVVDKFVTDESGEIITYEPLKVGMYRIREVEGPDGTFNEGLYVDIEITDKSYKTMIDEEGNEYKYAECIYYNNETYGRFTVEKKGPVVTGFDDGSVIDDELEIMPVSDLAEYETDGVEEETDCNENEESAVSNISFTFEDIFLKDVVFEVYAKEDIVTQDNQGTNWFDAGEKVATITTGKGAEFTKDCEGICSYTVDDETGNVTLTVPLGKYELREVITVYGRVLPEINSWDLEFKWKSQTDEYVYDISGNSSGGIISITNDLSTTDIKVVKKDAETETPLPNTTFAFCTKDNIYDMQGKIIVEAGTKLCTVITNEEGVATVPFSVPVMDEGYGEDTDAKLNSGVYYFIEESISESYYLEEEPFVVQVKYIDQDTRVIEAEVIVKNTRTEVEIDKLSVASSSELAGCHLVVKDVDGNVIVSWISGMSESVTLIENAEELGYKNLEAIIDENGNTIIKGLLHNKEYVLSETKPADGYTTANDIKFMLKEKVSEEGEVLTEVYVADVTGNYVESGSNKVVMYDDVTKVEFSKYASDTKKLLAGATYGVYDSMGNKVYEFTTTNGPTLIVGVLVAGETYTYVEEKVPDNYLKAEDVVITVKDTGEVQKISAIDMKEPDEPETTTEVETPTEPETTTEPETPDSPDTPQTGGFRYAWLLAILLVLAVVTTYSAIRINYGENKEDEN